MEKGIAGARGAIQQLIRPATERIFLYAGIVVERIVAFARTLGTCSRKGIAIARPAQSRSVEGRLFIKTPRN